MRLARVLLVLLATGLPAAASGEEITIAVGAPLTGADAIFGNQVRVGVEQAVADINASGGFLGQPARVVLGDDGGDPKKGVAVAKGFVGSNIKFVVGHVSSAVTVPASDVYAAAHVLEITPSALAPQVTERGLPLLFRTCGRDDQQAEVAAKFLLARHYARIAIVHDRTSTGKAFADAVRAALAAAGIREVYYGSFATETTDVSGLVGRMRMGGAQIVVWGGGAGGAALLVRQIDAAGARMPLLGGTGMASDDFGTAAGTAADGTFMVFPVDPKQRTAAAELIHRPLDRKFDPHGLAFYGYAAVQLIAQAAQAANSLEAQAIADRLHAGKPFPTVLGPLTFDAKGDPKTSDFGVFVWRKAPSGRMAFLNQATF